MLGIAYADAGKSQTSAVPSNRGDVPVIDVPAHLPLCSGRVGKCIDVVLPQLKVVPSKDGADLVRPRRSRATQSD